MRRLIARPLAIIAIVAGFGIGVTAVDAAAAPAKQSGTVTVQHSPDSPATAHPSGLSDWWW